MVWGRNVSEDEHIHKVSLPFPVWILSRMPTSGNHKNSELPNVKVFPRVRQAEVKGVWQLHLKSGRKLVADYREATARNE